MKSLSFRVLSALFAACVLAGCSGGGSKNKVTVTFDANGGTGEMNPQVFTKGTPAALNECAFTAPEKKEFGGWMLASDGTSAAYGDKAEYPADEDRTLYARWVGVSKLLGVTAEGDLLPTNGFNAAMSDYVTAAGASVSKLVFRVKQTLPDSMPDDAKVSAEDSEHPAWLSIEGGILYVNTDGDVFEAPADSRCMFAGIDGAGNPNFLAATLTAIDLGDGLFDTSNVTKMAYMFFADMKVEALDLSGFDTSGVTDMSAMFNMCDGLTELDVSGFDTSNVEDMSMMFTGCGGLTGLDVTRFDTSGVTNMAGMFKSCEELTSLDISGFDTSGVTNMSTMFSGCEKITELDLSLFDTSKVTDMSGMFNGCDGLTALDLSNFDTSSVTNMDSMFTNCKKLTSLDLSGFDTSNVTNMGAMFSSCEELTSLDISGFDTSNVTNMSSMFSSCEKITQLDLSSFDTSSVTNMSGMFRYCKAVTQLTLGDRFVVVVSEIEDFETTRQTCFDGFATTVGTHIVTVPDDNTRNIFKAEGAGSWGLNSLNGWNESGNNLTRTIT